MAAPPQALATTAFLTLEQWLAIQRAQPQTLGLKQWVTTQEGGCATRSYRAR